MTDIKTLTDDELNLIESHRLEKAAEAAGIREYREKKIAIASSKFKDKMEVYRTQAKENHKKLKQLAFLANSDYIKIKRNTYKHKDYLGHYDDDDHFVTYWEMEDTYLNYCAEFNIHGIEGTVYIDYDSNKYHMCNALTNYAEYYVKTPNAIIKRIETAIKKKQDKKTASEKRESESERLKNVLIERYPGATEVSYFYRAGNEQGLPRYHRCSEEYWIAKFEKGYLKFYKSTKNPEELKDPVPVLYEKHRPLVTDIITGENSASTNSNT